MAEQKSLTQRLESPQFKNHLMKVLPSGVTIDRHVAVALEQVRTNLKNGQGLHPMSIINAVYNAGSMGLSFNPAAKEAYFVPFGSVCTMIVGYKGLIKMCKNAGMENMTSKVIYEADDFDYEEEDGVVTYRYRPSFDEDRGNPICVLTVAYMENGDKDARVLPYHKVLKIKKAAKSKNIWNQHEEEMAQKTAIRRHCNQLPQSFDDPNLQSVIKMDEMMEVNKPILDTPEAIKDMEDDDYEDIVESMKDADTPQSSKPEVTVPVEEIPEAEEVVDGQEDEQVSEVGQESNIKFILDRIGKVTEEELKVTVEAEFGWTGINQLSRANVSKVIDFFVGGGE